eukprot:4175603-Amphidinium_carterae.1
MVNICDVKEGSEQRSKQQHTPGVVVDSWMSSSPAWTGITLGSSKRTNVVFAFMILQGLSHGFFGKHGATTANIGKSDRLSHRHASWESHAPVH